MRLLLAITFIFLTTLFFGFKPLTLPVDIIGHIKKNPKDTSVCVGLLTKFVRGDKKVLAKALTDDNGNFKMTITPAKEKSFDFFCTGVGLDTLFISSIITFSSEVPDMIFYVPVDIKRNALGKVICPKCNRTDKVYPIEYGEPHYVYLLSRTGDTTYSPFYKGTYLAGTDVVTSGKYYCDRDKIEF